MLEQIIDQAKKFELYDELYEVFHWLRNESGLRYGKLRFDKYTREMEHYRDCRDAVYEARNLYYDYYVFSDRTSGHFEKIDRVRNVLKTLLELKERTNSSQVAYYYYLILSELYTLERNRENAETMADALFSLLKKSPILKMDLKVGVAHSDVADMMLSCGYLDKAIYHSKRALNTFEKNTYNYFVAEKILFRALFLAGEFQHAKRTLNLTTNVDSESPLEREKYSFYQACLYFEQQECKKTIGILRDLRLLEKDKYGWNISIRILTIMSYIELENFDISDAQISSFRRYIDRLKQYSEIQPRWILISKILVSLRNESFNFKNTQKENAEAFGKLNSDELGFRRDEKSPELISFSDWFLKKVSVN